LSSNVTSRTGCASCGLRGIHRYNCRIESTLKVLRDFTAG